MNLNKISCGDNYTSGDFKMVKVRYMVKDTANNTIELMETHIPHIPRKGHQIRIGGRKYPVSIDTVIYNADDNAFEAWLDFVIKGEEQIDPLVLLLSNVWLKLSSLLKSYRNWKKSYAKKLDNLVDKEIVKYRKIFDEYERLQAIKRSKAG